jgi:hypothetical protein
MFDAMQHCHYKVEEDAPIGRPDPSVRHPASTLYVPLLSTDPAQKRGKSHPEGEGQQGYGQYWQCIFHTFPPGQSALVQPFYPIQTSDGQTSDGQTSDGQTSDGTLRVA